MTRKADYNAQVEGLMEQLVGTKAVHQSRISQSKTLDEEMRDTRELAKEGFVPRNQANQAERTKIDIDAGIVSTNAEIARIKLQISQVKTAFLKEVDTQLLDIQKTRDAVAIKMKAANFDAELSTVRAPSGGSVVALKVFTVGGVISSGQVLMEIVPSDGRLAVDVKIPPNLIDKVSAGMVADMRFVAFNQNTTPVITGELKIVGADKQQGLTAQDPEFYMAQIQTTLEGQERLGNLKVQPGMPVDVVIKSGHRSLVSYILKPLSDKFATAFKQ
jgi:protease secretion system membrane fusion protein